MRMPKKLLVILSLALVATACGGTETIGDQSLGGAEGGGRLEDALNKKDDGGQNAEETTGPTQPANGGNNDNNNGPTEAEIDRVSVKFKITNEGFDPYFIQVFVGGIVVVENADSQPRSVRDRNGAFDSGTLQPGKSWRYDANTPGEFTIEDGTRPYVVGTLKVIAQ